MHAICGMDEIALQHHLDGSLTYQYADFVVVNQNALICVAVTIRRLL